MSVNNKQGQKWNIRRSVSFHFQPLVRDMSPRPTWPNRAPKMVPKRIILYPKLNPEVDVPLSINFIWLRQSNISLHCVDLVQFIKRTGFDNFNIVIFQVTVGAEKEKFRVINKKIWSLCGFKNSVIKGCRCFKSPVPWLFVCILNQF